MFTAEREVKAMCDLIPNDIWNSVGSTFLEPACGGGVFILEILKRKFEKCKTRRDYTVALQSVYGMDIQSDNVETCINNIINLCERTFKITKAEKEIIKNHIIQADSLKVMQMIIDMREKQ